MIGEGPDKSKAEKMCEDLKISHLVKFLGNSSQVEKNLCHSDLFLLPSSTESFGLAALEAMASKVAVISSNAGGLSEININGKTGFTSDFDNIDYMTSKSINLLKSNTLLEKFKENAFTKALDYDINKIVPLYEKAYEDALNNAR
jgi:glycosyltransferase involved in cell wall biosynthesis